MSELHVIFGTGPLGRYTADALLKMGKNILMVNRSGKMADQPATVQVIASDAFDESKNIEITRGAATIYQCAQPRYYDWAEKFPSMQRAILNAAIANQAKLVTGDNLYMYGQFTGVLHEDAPIQPSSKKGRVRAAMAQEILDAHASGKVRAAIGRAADFFGPYDTALTSYAIQPAVAGKTINLMGSLTQPHTFTYIKDFGTLLATLGTQAEALGQIWFAPSASPLTQAALVKLLEDELGKPVKYMLGGPLMMRLLGLFSKDIRETVEMMYQWQGPFEVDTSKAQQAFGLKPTPLTQAMKETIAWCRTQAPNA
jgi:nucleoside-diphosphate-sugar epimerase